MTSAVTISSGPSPTTSRESLKKKVTNIKKDTKVVKNLTASDFWEGGVKQIDL